MLDLKNGDIFAGCRIIGICGHGGFGTVYLAENAVGRRVAVKIVNAPDKTAELNGIRCYMAESPHSPYLLPILHVGIERGELYYIMEAADPLDIDSPFYVADTLGRRLKIRGRLDPETALEITRKIAEAVEKLHRAGLLHRDIKPDNIIFVGGEPMLSDPGLLKPIQASVSLAGTLGFLPPECFSGEESNSIGSDIFAMGKVFYCALSGESPGRYPQLPRDLGTAVCRKLLPVLLRACNEKKEKRYKDLGEMLCALPEKLPAPGTLERMSEDFRLWRLMHGRIWNGILIAVLVLVLFCGYGAYEYLRQQRRDEAAAVGMHAAAENLRRKFEDGGTRLRLQLARALGETKAAELCRSPKSIPKLPNEALEYCGRIDGELRHAAETLFMAAKKIEDPLRRSGEVRSLLDSPAGECLTKEERKRIEDDLAADEAKHELIRSYYPSPGKVYHPDSSRSFGFAYVPPGEFVSPRTKKVVRIDYPLWVGITPLSVLQFSRIRAYIPDVNRELHLPVTRVLWNEVLFACEQAMHMFTRISPLPPGYVVRPLTEDEWEYCATGGMLRKRGGANSNAFGLYDLPGSVRESVLSNDHQNVGAYVLRGAARSDGGGDSLTRRTTVAFYQLFMPNSGTRLAIAPGTPELFEREFRFREDEHLHYQGRHYEFFGHLCANFDAVGVRDFCSLLGGRPAKLADAKLREFLFFRSSPVIRYPLFVDAEFRDGRWFWSDGTVLDAEIPAPRSDEHVMMESGKFKVGHLKYVLGFVCEWSRKEWSQRRGFDTPERRKLVPKTFRLGNRNFALVRMGLIQPHLARRCAEILGGRLPELDTPEIRRAVAEKLDEYSAEPTFLGGIWKRGRYRWFYSGRVIDGTLPLVGRVTDNAPSLATPSLVNGRLCATQTATQFLIEFPAASEK